VLFGYPGSYWLELRGYDPVATAAGLAVPMFLVQGGRDYQVTVEDDLARWRNGPAGRRRARLSGGRPPSSFPAPVRPLRTVTGGRGTSTRRWWLPLAEWLTRQR
jgi:hypothetical protein